MITQTKDKIQVDWEFHPRQSKALDILGQDLPELALLWGGAKGPGKSVLGCRWMCMEAEKIIDEFGLEESEYPLLIGFLGRKRGVDFNHTTLETWKREIPTGTYDINEQKHEIVIHNTVKYWYGGFDNRELIEKFNSAEFCRFFIDQAEECSEDEIAMLRATFRLAINGRFPQYKGLLTANPAQCWLKPAFVKNPQGKNNNFFLKALPSDNPYLPPTYIERLKTSFKHRPELLEAYLNGNWDMVAGAENIILDGWLAASHLMEKYQGTVRKIIAVDVARFGNDRTVMLYMEEGNIKDKEIYGQRGADYTTIRVSTMANNHLLEDGKPPLIVIDGDGLGGPVADFLRPQGLDVYEIHSAGASSEPEKFDNLRAEMWWKAGEMLARGEVCNTYFEDSDIEELDMELTIPKYYFKGGKIAVESKEDIKKPDRYGKSPDLADAYIYGLHGLKYARIPTSEPVEPGRKRQRKGLMAASPMGL